MSISNTYGDFFCSPYSSSSIQESLEERLARIESKLDSMGGNNNQSLDDLPEIHQPGTNTCSGVKLGVSGVLTPESHTGSASLTVPLLHEALPIIDAYFRDFNSVMPLFHQASFMKMLHSFYSGATRSSKVSWGIINAVLAIGTRMLIIEAGSGKWS